MAVKDFLIAVGGMSPDSATLVNTGGVSKATLRVRIGGEDDPVSDIQDVHDTIEKILGRVEVHNEGYKLARQMPLAHPAFPWLYATAISKVVGIGQYQVVDSDPEGDLEAEAFEEFPLYEMYELDVEFAAVPYIMAADSNISIDALSWIYDDGDGGGYAYANEWIRNTDYTVVPANEYIQASRGAFRAAVASGLNPNGAEATQGMVRMLWQKKRILFNWYRVPWSYVDPETADSFFDVAKGHVNQYSWYGWPAGTLLLEDIQFNDRTPAPIPYAEQWADTRIFASNKLVDIQFIMTYSDPPLGKDSAGNPATPPAAVNANAIQAGHNLFPVAHMGAYYYFRTIDATAAFLTNRPAYPSFPFELLFTDPES